MDNTRIRKYNNPVSATLTGIKDLFRKQVPAGVLHPSDRLDGKTVFIDGASSGLGRAAALELAQRGARVIMACRSGIPEQGDRVRKRSGNPDVHMVYVDYTDVNSIRSLVDTIKDGFPNIDIFILNAGIVPKSSRKTPQGLEEMFMVNYFSKFLLIHGLRNECIIRDSTLIANGSSSQRIIFVASESHRNPENFEWNNFGIYKDFSIGQAIRLYGYYKLLLTTFSVELSRRLNREGKTHCSVFALCPGPVNSNIAREAPKIFRPLLKVVFGIFFRSPAKAAIPLIYLAASPDVAGKKSDYLFLMERKPVDPKASDPENGRKLWELSERLLMAPEVNPSQ
jgi:NAD(P)-dependent dehydrogenase (short-subunit alcohol dehydrogenase family)